MLRMLIAYDASGEVVATLDWMCARNENGDVVGLIDFGAHEDAGGKLRDIWQVPDATGSATWPEWIGGRAHDFKVELDPATKRIKALVHKGSGHRRERAAVEQAIEGKLAAESKAAAAEGRERRPVNITDLVGCPERPLLLDDDGRNATGRSFASPGHLPVALARSGREVQNVVGEEAVGGGGAPNQHGRP